MVFDTKRPWRRDFALIRALHRVPAKQIASLARRKEARFVTSLPKYPDSIHPYLNFVQKRDGEPAAQHLISQLAASESQNPRVLTELAKYQYSRHRFAAGDRYLTLARDCGPNVLRVFDEEAWNQRFRGNIRRELEAVERCISLSSNNEEATFWRLWRGEIYVRLAEFENAWIDLRLFRGLKRGDRRLLTAGYCASVLGNTESAAQAYTLYAPRGSSYDKLKVASAQIRDFSRIEHSKELLTQIPSEDTNKELYYQSFFTVALREGRLSDALAVIRPIFSKPQKRPQWVARAYPQILELLNEPAAALEAYRSLSAKEHSPRSAHRLALLLNEIEAYDEICKTLIAPLKKLPSSNRALLLENPDPRIPQIVSKVFDRRDLEKTAAALEEIVPLLGSARSIRYVSRELSRVRFALGDKKRAVIAFLNVSNDRLPAIPLSTAPLRKPVSNLRTQYAEFRDTSPIRENVILYESSLGDTTSDTPFAICKYLLSQSEYSHYIHVWSINRGATPHPDLLGKDNVLFIEKGSYGHARYLGTAKFIINNSTSESYFEKRDGQTVLSTWHGTPWKTLGNDQVTETFAYGNIARSLLNSDFILAPNEHTERVLSESLDIRSLTSNRFIKEGYPRIDLSLNLSRDRCTAIHKSLNVPKTSKLIVYLPTWKGTMEKREAEVQETLRVAASLAGPGRTVALRAHHYVISAFPESQLNGEVVAVPSDIDTNELIGAADLVVTDFSSVLFDAAAAGVPVIKYIEALETYKNSRGLYFTAEEVPGGNAKNLDELAKISQTALANPEEFKASYEELTNAFAPYDDGQTTSRVWSAIQTSDFQESLETSNQENTLLISTGGLPTNGITRAVRSLIFSLQDSSIIPYFTLSENSLETATPETIADVRTYARILPRVGRAAGTSMEQEVLQYYATSDYKSSPFFIGFLRSGRQREARRFFGTAQFTSALEYSAYDARDTALICLGAPITTGTRGVILHNEMAKEIRSRFPRLASEMTVIDEADFIASVSDGVRDYNRDTLAAAFGVSKEKHMTLENTININEIMSFAEEPLSHEDNNWYAQTGIHACIVARLSPEKNHEQFLKALATERKSLPNNVYFTILGDGPLRMPLERLNRELGTDDLVRFCGLVRNPYPHIRACDGMLLPSQHEGQPIVILEALTLETPVIATDIPGSRSVLDNGKFGKLVDLSQAGIQDAIKMLAYENFVEVEQFDPIEFTRSSTDEFVRTVLN